jgi:rhodanese-related sulfurtransferase
MSAVAAVIDVRTPDEVAAGYLEGSLHIDIQGADFAAQMDELDKSANYVVYCRSGNRAGQAIEWMTQNGFTGTLTNAGSLADASGATGMAITQ